MFKQVTIAVWTAFIFWMALFLFSLNQAEASPSSDYENALRDYSIHLCATERNGLNIVHAPFDPTRAILAGDEKQCRGKTRAIIDNSAAKNTLPKTIQDLKAYSIGLTLEACTTPKDGITWEERRMSCFHAADSLLSNTPDGRHSGCYTDGGKVENATSKDKALCYQSRFEDDLNQAKKEVTDGKNNIQIANKAELQNFGEKICNWENADGHYQALTGLTQTQSRDNCTSALLLNLRQSMMKKTIPSDANEINLYEDALTRELCQLSPQEPDLSGGSFTRYGCFRRADILISGKSEGNYSVDCHFDASKESISGRTSPEIGGHPDLKAVEVKEERAYTASANCYDKHFKTDQESQDSQRLSRVFLDDIRAQNEKAGVK